MHATARRTEKKIEIIKLNSMIVLNCYLVACNKACLSKHHLSHELRLSLVELGGLCFCWLKLVQLGCKQ